MVFDRHDRIAFYNSRYPEHDDRAAARGPRASARTFEALLREGLASGPVYHPDMGEDFLDQRLAHADGQPQRACPPHRRRPLGADPREPRRRRRPGAAHHRHQRGAAARGGAAAARRSRSSRRPTRWRSPAPDHGFTFVNHAFETTTGYSQAEVLGRQPQDVLSSGLHPPEFFEAMRRELEAGRAWHGTIVNRHRDGHLIEQETTIAPLRDEIGGTTHYVAVKRDVTEARAQARALAASEARYRAVVDMQAEFILRVSPEGDWTFMNGAAERHVGMTLAEVRARGHRDPDFIIPEDLPVFAAHMARITPRSPTSSVEFRTQHPDGRLHWEALDRHRPLRRRRQADRDPVHRPR